MTTITLEGRASVIPTGDKVLNGEDRREAFSANFRTADSTKGDSKTPVVVFEGYASTVGVPYVMFDSFGEYEEVLAPTAFDVTLARNPDANFLVNHGGVSMARTHNPKGEPTLELSVDEVGLKVVATANAKRYDVQDLRHAIDDGDVDQMSFAFRIVDGRWSPDFLTYTITEVDLHRGDVSAVNYGANPNTSISTRTKQVLSGIESLSGIPLRIAAERMKARMAEQSPVAKSSPSVATLRARIELEEN